MKTFKEYLEESWKQKMAGVMAAGALAASADSKAIVVNPARPIAAPKQSGCPAPTVANPTPVCPKKK